MRVQSSVRVHRISQVLDDSLLEKKLRRAVEDDARVWSSVGVQRMSHVSV